MTQSSSAAQVALVTGASRGIGAAIALELAVRGYQVVGTATTDDGAERISQALAAYPGCRGANLNVNDGAAIEALMDSIVAAADKGKIKIQKIEDNTAANADIRLDCIAPGLAVPLAPEALEDTLASALGAIVACAQECVAQAGIAPDKMQAVYLTGGSSALAPLGEALARVFPQATLTVGDRFTSVAAGLAYGGAALGAGAEILDEIAA